MATPMPHPQQISTFTNQNIVIGTSTSFEHVMNYIDTQIRSGTLATGRLAERVERRAMTANELTEVGQNPASIINKEIPPTNP
jgi:hypothetical protein